MLNNIIESYFYYPHFTDEETKHLRSDYQILDVGESEFGNPGSF